LLTLYFNNKFSHSNYIPFLVFAGIHPKLKFFFQSQIIPGKGNEMRTKLYILLFAVSIFTLGIFSQTDEYGDLGYNGYLAGLNGPGNFVSVPSSTLFNQNTGGSMEMWIYPFTVAGTQQLIGKGISSNVQFIWGLSGNQQYFRIGTTVVTNTGGTVIPANQWTHIAVTWSGSNPYTITFYVNGALSGTTQLLSNAWASNSDPLKIGGPSGGFASEVYNGFIDEVRFWDPVRTLDQIRDNRFIGLGDGANSNGSGALTSSSSYSSLLASWNFNRTGTAFEYINGLNGTYTGSAISLQALGSQPIPYNMVLKCPGSGNFSYVTIPHNTVFNQNTDGTMEAWVYTTVNNQQKDIAAKGSTSNVSYLFGMASNGRLFARFGSSVSINNDGVMLPINQWVHVAWTWYLSSGSFVVTFYVNGQQSGTPLSNSGAFNINTNPMTIGVSQAFLFEAWNGYIDEVRYWSDVKTIAWLKANMFGSIRGKTSTAGLIGAWNFDGNLLNRSSGTGIDGSFSTGGTNDCRLSGFVNETTAGAIGTGFSAHNTVVNRLAAGNPFPGGFGIRAPYKVIPDMATIKDTINFGGNAFANLVEVFLSVMHTWDADLNITLTAPNGQVRTLVNGNGSSGDHILTFFVDGQTSVTNTSFLPPWSNICSSVQTLGNFGGSVAQGNWILTVSDIAGGDVGVLQGWGIRINNSLTGNSQIVNSVPVKFSLYQNYPNPFNPVTIIKYDIAKGSDVKLVVYDLLGREVKTLVSEFVNAGTYEISFDGSDLSSGTYFYKIIAGDYTEIRKMVILK
jgi:subtilisin-like proprotein convertase family protein